MDFIPRATHLLSNLSQPEQNLLASWLFAELAAEDDYDQAIARTSDKLVGMAGAALAEYRSGQTEELNPEKL